MKIGKNVVSCTVASSIDFAPKQPVTLKIYIKYMVSLRCKMIVQAELDKLGLHYRKVELGEVVITETLSIEQRSLLDQGLRRFGLELMLDKRAILIEKIKSAIIEMVHYAEEPIKINFSNHLAEKLDLNYTYLSGLFSEVTGTTIENYIITNKIERAKELLIYDELSLTEISYLLNYSSVAHLSNQFKKVTGLTPTFFKAMKHKRRRSLNNLK
jgi:AraC-like DNA-binding protein